MSEYLFFLGQNHPLSLAEIKRRLPQVEPITVNADRAYFELDFAPLSLASQLGGTTKIAQKLTDLSPDLEPLLVDQLVALKASTFCISLIGPHSQNIYSLHASLKEKLSSVLSSVRYILPKDGHLSPLVLARQHVTELIVDFTRNTLYHTIWVHDFNAWIIRDRQNPYITPRQGMLPPKLARIMVNLALGSRTTADTTFLDPFCGSGTLLSEARLLGLSTIGTDLSADQVKGTIDNLNWLGKIYPQNLPPFSVFGADATHLSEIIKTPIDLIVTEPYLGPLTPSLPKQMNIAKGLYKLYLGALKDWQKIVSPHHTIVLAYPLFEDSKTLKYFHDFIDTTLKLGYNQPVKNLLFTRPNAKIQRQIIILER